MSVILQWRINGIKVVIKLKAYSLKGIVPNKITGQMFIPEITSQGDEHNACNNMILQCFTCLYEAFFSININIKESKSNKKRFCGFTIACLSLSKSSMSDNKILGVICY